MCIRDRFYSFDNSITTSNSRIKGLVSKETVVLVCEWGSQTQKFSIKGKERNFLVSHHSSTGALIGDTVN